MSAFYKWSHKNKTLYIRRGADKYLAFPIYYFPVCSTTKRIFLGWVKDVRTMKPYVCGAQGGICRVNTFSSIP
jgi:hypothetical protein